MSDFGAIAPGFHEVLAGYDIGALDAQGNSILGLTLDLRIGYWNPAWARFARENGGHDLLRRWPLGASMVDVIPAVLRPAFDRAIANAPSDALGETLRYSCSSPTVERNLSMLIHRREHGYVFVHSKVMERPMPWAASVLPIDDYRDHNRFVTQCANCRRVHRPDDSASWDWVPEAVARRAPNVSHGLCDPCVGLLYPTI